MSTLHKLKAYFGMVPAEEFDDYGPDYPDDYHPGYDQAYESDPGDAPREHAYSGDRPSSYRTRRAEFDGYGDDFAAQPPRTTPPPIRAPRSSWPEPTVHGSLAVDTAPPVREPVTPPRSNLFGDDDAHPLGRIVTLHPHSYHEARPIGERYREGAPVIMNLTGMEDKDARRLVDFAAGLAFALHGSIDKVTNKVFLLSPANVEVSAEDRRRLAEGGLFGQR
jgi:cell division inhibitor SepF